jgi:EAL domain-containing protein (putative c-di-GMP-specific phosphodiesterase class I)
MKVALMTVMTAADNVTETTPVWYVQGTVSAEGQPQKIDIPSGRFRVGRRTDMNLRLSYSSVSKLHAEFIATDIALFIRDLGSTNGTFVNGRRIAQDTLIADNDIVQFAEYEFVVGRTKQEQAMRTIVSLPQEWQGTLTKFHQLLSERAVIPYFQPIVSFADSRPVGYEVLARSTCHGMTSPKEMFEAAERVSLAAQLSVICRENGIAAARSLAKPGQLFLNTHPSEHPQIGLLESLIELRSMAPESEIVLELHEAAVTNPREMSEFRVALRELNIQLAYDDFGSGQARLMELSEVAPDYLKFDIGLIREIHLAPQRQQIVAGLVQIVRDLGIKPLAEGIEIAEEAEVCHQLGFTHAQGYFYGKPMPSHAIRCQ